MDDKIRYWFQGFEQGVAALGTSQQEALFHECGKNCVQQGTLEFYQSLYRTAEGNLDRFFEAVNDTPGLRGEVMEPDTVYLLALRNALARLLQRDMCGRRGCASAPGKAFYTFCGRSGRKSALK